MQLAFSLYQQYIAIVNEFLSSNPNLFMGSLGYIVAVFLYILPIHVAGVAAIGLIETLLRLFVLTWQELLTWVLGYIVLNFFYEKGVGSSVILMAPFALILFRGYQGLAAAGRAYQGHSNGSVAHNPYLDQTRNSLRLSSMENQIKKLVSYIKK